MNTVYTVRGRGAFPIDMMRYDRSYPYSEENSIRIQKSLTNVEREEFEVTLIRLNAPSNWNPGAVRWSSFCWTVIETHFTVFDT